MLTAFGLIRHGSKMSSKVVKASSVATSNHVASRMSSTSSSDKYIDNRSYADEQNFMWAPGPYPVTEEARRAAAKKYNMLYEDYKPHDDHSMSYGDYPKLEPYHGEERGATMLDWDYTNRCHNYGECIDIQFLARTDILPDVDNRSKAPVAFEATCELFGFCLAVYVLWLMSFPTTAHGMAEIQKPEEASSTNRHYTFDLVD